jgi:CHAD domain-containing protein
MAFCFKRKESVSKAIRRLGRERIEDALECLKDCPNGEAIHCARKDIKKVRAVLRLVRTGLDGKGCRRVAKPLREAAKYLAEPRDALVKVKTLENVMRHFKGQLAPTALRQVRGELRKRFDKEMNCFAREKNKKATERVLRRVVKELEHLEVNGKGWKVLGPGVKAAYADGKRAYQIAVKDSAPENFHEWRKRVKDLWYQITLLRRMWPEQMDAIARELETLGESLGDHHDLIMLRQTVQEMGRGEHHGREVETLYGLIEERQRELRPAALAIGARFYAEKPAEFCERLAGYWKIWRRERKSARRHADTTS